MIQIDHIEYPKRVKKLSNAVLKYIIADCKLALNAYPTGIKTGYYADEIHYAAMELQNRKGK